MADDTEIQEREQKLWTSRRGTARLFLTPVASTVLKRNIGMAKDNGFDKEESEIDQATQQEDAKNAFLFTAAAAAISATVLRVGGRAALVELLGLDFVMDSGIKDQLNTFIDQAQSMGDLSYLYFFAAWVFAKLFCLDFIPVVLALSSGVLFGGVLQGALLSTGCATAASFIGFLLGRTALREKVEEQMGRRPALRAVERAVSAQGLKTVLTLRLAPVLPIPIGAYNYLYGATRLAPQDFLVGMFIGSFKPYFLDAYLGVFGKSILDNTGDSSNDFFVIIIFALTILVGTLATQVATRTWDEIQAEAAVEASEKGLGEGGKLGWKELWGVGTDEEKKTEWQKEMDRLTANAEKRINYAVEDEWDKLLVQQYFMVLDEEEQKIIRDQCIPKSKELEGTLLAALSESKSGTVPSFSDDGTSTIKALVPPISDDFSSAPISANKQEYTKLYAKQFFTESILFSWLFFGFAFEKLKGK
eukprot:CAMPEP_0194731392 /NCGR_PEP_ID=MMETSP0296-20130528/57181_1 /TAXON_ID=39354 /ORGANISM="Heterosigma akashiwo, Strain CCMP2393" /LENGTH=473 /DNA_ID=CAMNT_0039638901 /DNA_START=162 /DNA_END=1583 /DNA_ORIENTATION=+